MRPVICHHVVCQHQVEVEVWPALAEVYFRDERFVNPVNTKVQFEAAVYNAPTSRVTWEVHALDGGPGAGVIDAAGLYLAPLKGSLPYGFTEIVTATSVDDPFRQAHARVCVIGLGPEPKPKPRVEIFPRRANLYYSGNLDSTDHNEYIDASNTMQLFRARLFHADPASLEWLLDLNTNPEPQGPEFPDFLYRPAAFGNPTTVRVTVRLSTDHTILDWATVSLLNYEWPGIVP